MTEPNVIENPQFNDMSIQQLRQYASHMQIALEKTANKEQIIKAIDSKLQGRNTPALAEDGNKLKPGYAKIKIIEDSTPGAQNFPVYLNCNGYQCTIPRGREVIVPIRVVRTLDDAKTKRRQQVWMPDPNTGRESMKETVVNAHSYPFTVLDIHHGPELLTPLEAARLKVMAPRKKYRDMFGHYPKRGELKRAIEQGFIKLDPKNEALSDSEETAGLHQE